MRIALVCLTALVACFAIPAAAAIAGPAALVLGSTSCSFQEFFAEEPSEQCPAIDTYTSGGETYYLTAIGPYRESNGCEGLQTMDADCDGDGVVEPHDDRVNVGDLVEGDGIPDV